jgi:hypothetical protein
LLCKKAVKYNKSMRRIRKLSKVLALAVAMCTTCLTRIVHADEITTIEDLPPEILVEILKYLSTEDIASASQVSKQWRGLVVGEVLKTKRLRLDARQLDSLARTSDEVKQNARYIQLFDRPSEMTQEVFAELARFPNLVELAVNLGPEIQTLKLLHKLSNLRKLVLFHADNITSLKPLAKLARLEELDISGFYKISSVESLSRLDNLKVLRLSYSKVDNLPKHLESLQNLQSLQIRDFSEITSLEPITRLENLEELVIVGCKNITTLEQLSNLRKLRKLKVDSRLYEQAQKLQKTIQGLELF